MKTKGRLKRFTERDIFIAKMKAKEFIKLFNHHHKPIPKVIKYRGKLRWSPAKGIRRNYFPRLIWLTVSRVQQHPLVDNNVEEIK